MSRGEESVALTANGVACLALYIKSEDTTC